MKDMFQKSELKIFVFFMHMEREIYIFSMYQTYMPHSLIEDKNILAEDEKYDDVYDYLRKQRCRNERL